MLSRMKTSHPTMDPRVSPQPPTKSPQAAWELRLLHRTSAMLLAGFVLMHLGNHVAGLAGVGLHLEVMETLRTLYRQGFVEALLLASVLFQIGSGARLLWRGRGGRSGWAAWAQTLSGAYLAFFMLVHVGAVLSARVQGVDTNIYFAAAGLHVAPWHLFFAPYYFLGVLSFWTHAGCGLYWNVPACYRQAVLGAMLAVGIVMASALVLWMVAGIPLENIPVRYLTPFVPNVHGA